MSAPPAQPHEYDLAFVFRTDERVMWPLEAKVLETPRRMSNYMRDLNEEYLTFRYAPFSNSAAMLGYLLTGRAGEAFLEIEGRLGQKLEGVPAHATRPNRMSHHKRDVPRGTRYPSEFSCFHLILEYRGLRRAGGRRASSGEDIESPAVGAGCDRFIGGSYAGGLHLGAQAAPHGLHVGTEIALDGRYPVKQDPMGVAQFLTKPT